MATDTAIDTTSTSSPQEAIKFVARGSELDTCLKVFDTEFHVHSTILKMHSASFHRLLDSADKIGKPKAQLSFKHSYITEVDEVGWYLVADCTEDVGVDGPFVFSH